LDLDCFHGETSTIGGFCCRLARSLVFSSG
jgi:hypothetical protein